MTAKSPSRAVRSWLEFEEAERVAWSAPGVRKVNNHIVVSGDCDDNDLGKLWIGSGLPPSNAIARLENQEWQPIWFKVAQLLQITLLFYWTATEVLDL